MADEPRERHRGAAAGLFAAANAGTVGKNAGIVFGKVEISGIASAVPLFFIDKRENFLCFCKYFRRNFIIKSKIFVILTECV